MSTSKLSPKEQEELNKLENEAIEELYQIIALAHQMQDIDWLNSMISAWESKYKKILNNPSPEFKKKIEQLRNYTYSKVVEYILSQIKFKEQKMIENQRKALNQLYRIIKDNSDLDTLKENIKKWENKYPYNSFLKMYQKRIDLAKREKNLEQYAFKQEEAFKDLYYGVVNRSGTIEELKEYLNKWEEKYSINDKFTIDQFIKHQSEIRRYTSDEFLISIAKKDDNILDEKEPKTVDSSIDAQDSAYKRLESIVKGNNNIYDVFKWVYENNSIKFNDYYKQRILNATYLNYSPKYLKTLKVPDINLAKASLPIEQYNKMDEILRYAVISYFNLLLPANQAISNKYFTEHMRTIYYEAERTRHSNIINTFSDEVLSCDIKIPLVDNLQPTSEVSIIGTKATDDNIHFEKSKTVEDVTVEGLNTSNIEDTTPVTDVQNEQTTIEEIITSSKVEIKEPNVQETTIPESEYPSIEEFTFSEIQSEYSPTESISSYEVVVEQPIIDKFADIDSLESDAESFTFSLTRNNKSLEETSYETDIQLQPIDNTSNDNFDITLQEESEPNSYNTTILLLPSFFETINNYCIQATLVQTASTAAQKINTPPSIDKSNDKTRNQS